MNKFWIPLAALLVVSGCGGRPSDVEKPAAPAASAETPHAAIALFPEEAGSVKGKVTFLGEVPAPRELPIGGNPECSVFHKGKAYSEELLVSDGAVRNVFVYVKQGLEGRSFPPPAEPVTIENKNCLYVPRVVGVQTGQPVIFKNEDPTLHNIHSYSKASKAFNLGLPFQGMKQTRKFDAPEVMVTMKCDVHPWMIGYVGVVNHPYFAVTGADGTFEIGNLPPGEYVIEAWHEKLGVRSQTVRIEPRETKTADFSFSS